MSISIDGSVGGPDGGIEWVLDIDREATAWNRGDRSSPQSASIRTYQDLTG